MARKYKQALEACPDGAKENGSHRGCRFNVHAEQP
jgi:hypothetical protein